MKSSAHYFHIKAKILSDFQICISVPLKDISFNTKYFLVWYDWSVITCLIREIFGINHPRDFWKFWNCSWAFYSGNFKVFKNARGCLTQIALPNMRLLVQTFLSVCNCYVTLTFLHLLNSYILDDDVTKIP